MQVYPGQHEAIIGQATWDGVRARMDTAERETRCRWTHTHLLKGKLRTFENYAMSPGSVERPISKRPDVAGAPGGPNKRLVRYYVSQKAITRRSRPRARASPGRTSFMR